MDTETLTPAQIAGRLRASLATIRDLWDEATHPTYASLGPKVGSGDLARIERIADASRTICDDLRSWCQIMARDLTPDVRLPNTHDVADMVRYLLADIDMFSYRPEAWDDMHAAEAHAATLRTLVFGAPAPEMALCPCPLADCDGGTVRATPLEDEAGNDLARCDRCATLLTPSSWLNLAGIHRRERITRTELIDLAHQQFGITLSPHAITCLIGRHVLAPVDANSRPQEFDLRECVNYLTRRLASA